MTTKPSTSDGSFTILYFASASSYTSKDAEVLAAPLPVAKLFDLLEEKYTGIKSKVLESCLLTVNLEYVDVPSDASSTGLVIKAGDEVAIIPPVSSG
ncbi:MoaD/ThiS [Glarea lozoyensis ATCC 20868]|uniref:Molybdopterin synthase sulfur carrier subunit n=1 Tax=Glarea lozoyensis (strain ATCC 20868 / MF5171) TaxID=1116229 RepID=S3CWF5_GLAL2|nr:MoaD/ThiS [Glarea lozoyensis ATCC 20868]EPE29259.1 MoaD/ThiS [Glarea lozoyensis ATCC 20868]